MDFIFFGTPRFAEIFLSELLEKGLKPKAVVTNPDRPAGRKKEMTPPAVKMIAEKSGIPVFQPESLTGANLPEAEFGVVAAYGSIVPESVINMFPKGIICVHPSLLPKYRGATPIQTAILNEERETGTTLFLLDKLVDHGPILAQKEMGIAADEDYLSLEEKLARISAELFSEVIGKYVSGKLEPLPQEESKATLTKKFSRDDAFVPADELKNACEGTGATRIYAKIRALNPEPGAWTRVNGKEIKLLEAEMRDGKLVVKTVQPEGKKPYSLNSSSSIF
jgi:methionyl-tRNA formyltransferase